MRWMIALGMLSGCELVFPLDETVDGTELCAGEHTQTPLITKCGTIKRTELPPMPDIDTGSSDDPTDLADCDAVISQGDADDTQLCVIGAESVVISTTKVRGTRPLLLAALHELRVVGGLSVASHRGAPDGAGANFLRCSKSLPGGEAIFAAGGGGGAGGSFQTAGAAGGLGEGDNPGGTPGTIEPTVGFVRGGCRGADGGHSESPLEFDAFGGSGGGAIYLLAGDSIVIEGLLDASGAGGSAGTQGDDSDTNTGGAGGAGGGSGGMIALDAPMIVVAAGGRMVANGGGGGGGGPPDTDQLATGGDEPGVNMMSPFLASGGTSDGGGDGGDGATKLDLAEAGALNDTVGGGGGGGGGGGLGHILTFGPFMNMGELSPDIDN